MGLEPAGAAKRKLGRRSGASHVLGFCDVASALPQTPYGRSRCAAGDVAGANRSPHSLGWRRLHP